MISVLGEMTIFIPILKLNDANIAIKKDDPFYHQMTQVNYAIGNHCIFIGPQKILRNAFFY